jgi:hypothetical protein
MLFSTIDENYLKCTFVLSRDEVTIDGVSIGDRIYWAVIYSACLQLRIMLSLFYTLHSSLESTRKTSQTGVTSPSSGNGMWPRTFPFLWVPELTNEPEQVSNSPLH